MTNNCALSLSLSCCVSVGRADPTVEDLEMVFRDNGVSVKEMVEYTKNVEPLSLGQPVPDYPAELQQTKVDIFIPELDDEGKVVKPSATEKAEEQSGL